MKGKIEVYRRLVLEEKRIIFYEVVSQCKVRLLERRQTSVPMEVQCTNALNVLAASGRRDLGRVQRG